MRLIDADAFCGFLREVSTRHHYERLLTKKDRYPTVADVIEEICCDLDGTSLNGFDNCPTVFAQEDIDNVLELAYISGQQHPERPKGKWEYIGQSEVTGLKIVKCTNCHKRQYGSMDYCGNCGADMRGDV